MLEVEHAARHVHYISYAPCRDVVSFRQQMQERHNVKERSFIMTNPFRVGEMDVAVEIAPAVKKSRRADAGRLKSDREAQTWIRRSRREVR
jgi:hypothetical protein